MGSFELQQLRRFDGACILSVEGEIDDSTADAFERGLEVGLAGSRRLVVDLTTCTVSSEGLEALMRFDRRSRDCGAVTLVARDGCLLRMLDAVGLTTKLETYPTVNDALSSKAEQARTYRTPSQPIRRGPLGLAVEK